MTTLPIHGSITALITPFKNGEVDGKAFQDFVQWQIVEGTHGLVPCGTTGEAPTLFDEEDGNVIRMCVEVAKGKVPVIAGCGTNNTAHAIHLTQAAEKLGADAALHVAPYYNKPTQEGLYQHYKAIHDSTGLPIIVYNIPGRSVVNMTPETMARLAQLPRIAGVKDATGDLSRPVKTRKLCGPDFIQLSGNDETAIAFLAQGGTGCISVVSNIAPALCARMQDAWRKGDIAAAQKINEQLAPLVEALFVETSPSPVKFAASLLGKCRNELRLPMVPVSKATEKLVREAMAGALLDVPLHGEAT
ncbi:MAG: 4-hydroxy-tetrahydrodipicolinate synthase [Alphaproteobacteria bacterium]|nr:4-hydroxy-tetrahydrodipicolinate synthase [Alphaproteobacteria bacterium]